MGELRECRSGAFNARTGAVPPPWDGYPRREIGLKMGAHWARFAEHTPGWRSYETPMDVQCTGAAGKNGELAIFTVVLDEQKAPEVVYVHPEEGPLAFCLTADSSHWRRHPCLDPPPMQTLGAVRPFKADQNNGLGVHELSTWKKMLEGKNHAMMCVQIIQTARKNRQMKDWKGEDFFNQGLSEWGITSKERLMQRLCG
eukprot:gnl/TRDRNA2_/TRDRNA2_193334_c0_seq1.p1 gnl/TRDRNA2_/TRDRNA2_193334_c0~~gnl/TRDRNA2_/TRDRNA2_193334_c0_seq1.p1  ORF type:complete len:209 (+),score=32.63 gnl/TRDRNA2_/TRDRNA2_193334_c0_seq1:33-629(+)